MECNICGCGRFVDMNSRKGVRCAACGSLERTRVLWKFLERVRLPKGAKILHIAPEKGLSTRLTKMAEDVGGSYIAADIDPGRFTYITGEVMPIDLCDLESFSSEDFDLIVHAHVLEHIPCNIFYPIFHLHRMLKRSGQHVCVIPFTSGGWDECFANIGDEERVRRFGQSDHVRRFGRDDVADHVGRLLRLPQEYDLRAHFPGQELERANIPSRSWRGLNPDTVLVLRREDMLAWGAR